MLPLLPLTTTAQSSEMRGTSTIQQIKNIKKQTHWKIIHNLRPPQKNNRFLGKYFLIRSEHYDTTIHLAVEFFFLEIVVQPEIDQWRIKDLKIRFGNPHVQMEPSETLGQYCWLKKFCTTWDVKNPVHNGMNYLSTGAGFLPSTVTVILQISSLGAQNVRRYTEIYRDVLRLAKKK